MSGKHLIDKIMEIHGLKWKYQVGTTLFVSESLVSYVYNDKMKPGDTFIVRTLRKCPQLTMKMIDQLIALPHE